MQSDHDRLVAVTPPKYEASAIVGKAKANTSRAIRQRFPEIEKFYWRNEFRSVGVLLVHRRHQRSGRHALRRIPGRWTPDSSSSNGTSGSDPQCHGREPVGI